MLELEAKKGAKEMYMWSPYEVFKVEPKSFSEIFKEFILNASFVSPEVINCIHEIKSKCNNIQDLDFFHLQVPQQPYKLEEFKSTNDQTQLSNIGKVKNTLMNDVVAIIQNGMATMSKEWYNLKETDKDVYE